MGEGLKMKKEIQIQLNEQANDRHIVFVLILQKTLVKAQRNLCDWTKKNQREIKSYDNIELKIKIFRGNRKEYKVSLFDQG